MSKLTLTVLVVLAVSAQGFPPRENDIATAAFSGNWEEVHKILADRIREKYNLQPYLGDVRSLKPEQGGHVYGESELVVKTSSNVNGQTSEQSGGHKVINEDGHVTEFDFKP